MKKRGGFLGLMILVACWTSAGVGLAQTDAEVNAGIQFNFTTPGARSLALGGAFVGRADDATTAFTNPGGLVNLTEPQVSTEVRRFTFKNTFSDRGHAFGPATGFGIDTVEGLRLGEAESEVDSLSFLSYVHPRGVSPVFGETDRPLTRWALAFYRHELVRFEAAFRANGAFYDYFDASGMRLTTRLLPLSAVIDLEIVNLGVSGAVRLTRDFSLGLGFSRYALELDSLQQRFELDDSVGDFGPPSFSPSLEENFQRQQGTDEDFALNLGFFWQIADAVSLGGVYRQGPRFDFLATNQAGAAAEVFGVPRGTLFNEATASFKVPDVLGLGLAIQASPAIRITLDANRVEYSQLTDRTVSIFGIERPQQQAALEALEIADGEELRAGFEYAFLDRDPTVYVRFGAWYDPDHKIGFTGEPGIDPLTRGTAVRFQGGRDVVHATAGIGFAFARSFKLDAAVDLAETYDSASLSFVYRFAGRE